MKIITVTKKLKQALSSVEHVISKNLNLPILSTALLKVEQGRLKISATNLEIGINTWIGGKVERTGEVAVSARLLSSLVAQLMDDKTELSFDGKLLHVKTKKLKTSLVSFNTSDFPLIPKIRTNEVSVMPVKVLRNLFVSVADAASLSDTRPELSGVFASFEKEEIRVAATDSFRLAERIVSIKNKKEENVIIPRPTILEVIRIFSERNEDIGIAISDNQIQFKGDNIEIISRLIEGTYPDYQHYIPERFTSKALYKTSELIQRIKAASVFTSSINDITLRVKEAHTEIYARDQDKGEFTSSMDSQIKNNPFEVLVNYQYLLEGLKHIVSDKVIMGYSGEESPLLIEPQDKDMQYRYIIMPLRG